MDTYNGRWWQHLDEEQQKEVVDGFLDGALSHGVAPGYLVGSAEELARLYHREPSLLTAPIATVLRTRGEPAAPALPGGERYVGKHGFFDGDYWFQTSPGGRIGYVEGYLLATSPVSSISPAHAATVSRSITRWYGFDRDDAAPDANHPASTAVGDVLARVDHATR